LLAGPDDVLIKLNATGLCLSDVHWMINDWGGAKMSEKGVKCAGHEGAGVIVKVGERVKNFQVGQRAGLKPIYDVCHSCVYCKTNRENFCENLLECGDQVDGMVKPLAPALANMS